MRSMKRIMCRNIERYACSRCNKNDEFTLWLIGKVVAAQRDSPSGEEAR